MISDCCGAKPNYEFDELNGLCSKCKEHCSFIDSSLPDPDYDSLPDPDYEGECDE